MMLLYVSRVSSPYNSHNIVFKKLKNEITCVVCKKSNIRSATSKAVTPYSSAASEFTPGI